MFGFLNNFNFISICLRCVGTLFGVGFRFGGFMGVGEGLGANSQIFLPSKFPFGVDLV